jgi:hypothetical protein
MAFIVEDGTGLSNANSYVGVAYANAYFAERAVTSWDSLDDEIKLASLIKATDYFELRWSHLLISEIYNETQSLSFPRKYIGTPIFDEIDTELLIGYTIPDKILKATCEYAIRASTGELVTDISTTAGQATRVKIGVIEKETNFTANQKKPETFATYPSADNLVKPYLKSTSGKVIK